MNKFLILSLLTVYTVLGFAGHAFAGDLDKGFVTPRWLADHLRDGDVRVIAVTHEPENFVEEHIPGSVYVDWRTELADTEEYRYYKIVPRQGFEKLMSRSGVSEDTTVVFYDDFNNRHAIRALWVAEYYGHEKAVILEGGIEAWKDAGFTTTDRTARYTMTDYRVRDTNPEINAEREFVRSHMYDDEVLIVDGRPESMYTGMTRGKAVHTGEKFDRRGHIPGAANLPWKKNIDSENRFLDSDILRAFYESKGITGETTTVFYCNEGVHAAYDWFVAHKILGLKNVAIYDGSMAEWTDDPDLPMESGPE